MDYITHEAHRQAAELHAGPTMPPSAHGHHDRHAGHSVAMFRDKLWLSFALAIPVVVWSPEVQHWLGYTAPSFPGSTLLPATLGTIVFLYGGIVFIRGAVGELADRKPGMMTLISLAIIVVACSTSLAATFGFFQIEVWWELASLITIMILGHWLEMRAIAQARGALHALAVSPAGYYAWRDRPESRRARQNRTLLSTIRVIHRESRETYGSPSIWDALIKRGHGVGENRIARLMRVEGIRAKTVKKWRATTQSNHSLPVAENTLNRQFTVQAPNQVWAGDSTYVWTAEGWLYLAVVLDLYSRAVIGWAMGARLTGNLALDALTMALQHRTPTTGLLHHSDRGSMPPRGISTCSPHTA